MNKLVKFLFISLFLTPITGILYLLIINRKPLSRLITRILKVILWTVKIIFRKKRKFWGNTNKRLRYVTKYNRKRG